jgi:hypothetical protein
MSYDVDMNWYTDSGVTDHITGDLEKLVVRDKYLGNDQVHTASGSGMDIDQIGHSVIHTSTRDLALNNVLYVPQASKNLVPIHRFTLDNHVFLEIHPWHFLIKDGATKRVLHHGKVERGLYPLKSSKKQVSSATKPSQARWHNYLGHPSLQIVHQVVSQNIFPVSSESISEEVCDACQRGKAHQLPYPKLFSVSKVSIGRKKYYVSFIDNFSKFVWICTLNRKSEIFERFMVLQNPVERLFDSKILAMQTNLGGEYQKLNIFF